MSESLPLFYEILVELFDGFQFLYQQGYPQKVADESLPFEEGYCILDMNLILNKSRDGVLISIAF